MCLAQPRIKWKRRYIKALRKLLKHHQTAPILIDTMCTSITEYFDTGQVNITKYPKTLHHVLNSQAHIGWRQIFLGKLSQEWENTHNLLAASTTNAHIAFLWGTSIVELSLRHAIILWEERNTEVHGKDNATQQNLLVARHRTEIKRLYSLRHKLRPSDVNILFKGINTLLTVSDSKMLSNWIATRRPAIYHSIKRAQIESVSNTSTLLNWFRPLIRIQPRRIWNQDKLIYDPFAKKKRHKQADCNIASQPSITSFLTLRDVL